MKKILLILFLLILFFWIIIYFGNEIIIKFETNEPSKSIGTANDGSLINGKRLPTQGENFITYSRLGSLLGRNSVHEKVRKAVLEAYDAVYKINPELNFVYGETSWPNGGKFWPHKSHRNGLSVDFMVPVKDTSGEYTTLPSNIFNKFGYGIEFDSSGNYEDLRIDFDAISLHLLELEKAAKKNDLKIEIVIFDNDFQKKLINSNYGKKLKNKIIFSKLESWIRHDEHYHVNFKVLKRNLSNS